MAASSVGTYLDITRAAGQATVGTEEAASSADFTNGAARVLAAVRSGATDVKALAGATKLDEEFVERALDWLARAELVTVRGEGGIKHIELSDPARSALS